MNSSNSILGTIIEKLVCVVATWYHVVPRGIKLVHIYSGALDEKNKVNLKYMDLFGPVLLL